MVPEWINLLISLESPRAQVIIYFPKEYKKRKTLFKRWPLDYHHTDRGTVQSSSSPNTAPPWGKVYTPSISMFQRGFIHPSTAPVGASFFFVENKNRRYKAVNMYVHDILVFYF